MNFHARYQKDQVQLVDYGTNIIIQELPVIDAKEEHRSYILSTWVRSFETMARRMVASCGASLVHLDPDCFRGGEARVAERLWQKAKVLTSPGDAYTIHGWFCLAPSLIAKQNGADSGELRSSTHVDSDTAGSSGILYHCYVPPDLRRHGISRAVVEHFLGKTYRVSKPWPKTPTGHYCTWDPYDQA